MKPRRTRRALCALSALLLLCACFLSACTAGGTDTAAVWYEAAPANRSWNAWNRNPQKTKAETQQTPEARTIANVLAFLSGKPEVGKLYDPYPGTDFTGIYIGRYFNFDIVLEQGELCTDTVIKIGPEQFRHYHDFALWASKNGHVLDLRDVYATGCMSEPQLSFFSIAFSEMESQWRHPAVGTGDPAALTPDELALLNNALREKCDGDAFGVDGLPIDGVRYYGKFSGMIDPDANGARQFTYYAFFVERQCNVNTVTYVRAGSSFFYHINGFAVMIVTPEGELMMAQEAYDAGLLLRDDTVTLARTHKTVEMEVEQYEEKGWTYPNSLWD